MSESKPFSVSQDFSVMVPKSDNAFPIPCEEWTHLKTRIGSLSNHDWLFHTIGSLLLGGSISIASSVWLGAITDARTLTAVWAAFWVCTICGVLCLYVAVRERKSQKTQAGDVLAQMELIERRFERRDG